MQRSKGSQKRKGGSVSGPHLGQSKIQNPCQNVDNSKNMNTVAESFRSTNLVKGCIETKQNEEGNSSIKGTDSFLKSMDSIIFAVKSGKTPATPQRGHSPSTVESETPKRIAKPNAVTPIVSPRPFSGKASRITAHEQSTVVSSINKTNPKGITPNTRPSICSTPVATNKSSSIEAFKPLSSSTPVSNRLSRSAVPRPTKSRKPVSAPINPISDKKSGVSMQRKKDSKRLVVESHNLSSSKTDLDKYGDANFPHKDTAVISKKKARKPSLNDEMLHVTPITESNLVDMDRNTTTILKLNHKTNKSDNDRVQKGDSSEIEEKDQVCSNLSSPSCGINIDTVKDIKAKISTPNNVNSDRINNQNSRIITVTESSVSKEDISPLQSVEKEKVKTLLEEKVNSSTEITFCDSALNECSSSAKPDIPILVPLISKNNEVHDIIPVNVSKEISTVKKLKFKEDNESEQGSKKENSVKGKRNLNKSLDDLANDLPKIPNKRKKITCIDKSDSRKLESTVTKLTQIQDVEKQPEIGTLSETSVSVPAMDDVKSHCDNSEMNVDCADCTGTSKVAARHDMDVLPSECSFLNSSENPTRQINSMNSRKTKSNKKNNLKETNLSGSSAAKDFHSDKDDKVLESKRKYSLRKKAEIIALESKLNDNSWEDKCKTEKCANEFTTIKSKRRLSSNRNNNIEAKDNYLHKGRKNCSLQEPLEIESLLPENHNDQKPVSKNKKLRRHSIGLKVQVPSSKLRKGTFTKEEGTLLPNEILDETIVNSAQRKITGRRLSLKRHCCLGLDHKIDVESQDNPDKIPHEKPKPLKRGRKPKSTKYGIENKVFQSNRTLDISKTSFKNNKLTNNSVDDFSSPTVRKKGRKKAKKLITDSEESDDTEKHKSEDEKCTKNSETVKEVEKDNYKDKVVSSRNSHDNIPVIHQSHSLLQNQGAEEHDFSMEQVDMSVLEKMGDQTLEDLEKSVLHDLPQKLGVEFPEFQNENHANKKNLESENCDSTAVEKIIKESDCISEGRATCINENDLDMRGDDISESERDNTLTEDSSLFVCEMCRENRKNGEKSLFYFKKEKYYHQHLMEVHQVYDYKGVELKHKKKKSQGGIKMIEDEGGGLRNVEQTETDDHSGGRKRRNAAKKAISRWKEAEVELQEIKKAEKDMSSTVKYYKPTDQMPIPQEYIEKMKNLKNTMNKKYTIKCPYHEKGCTKVYWHPASIKVHVKTCNYGRRRMEYKGFQCSQCNFKVKNEAKMKKHITKHDWPDDTDSYSEGNDTDTDNDPDVDYAKERKQGEEMSDEESESEGESSEEEMSEKSSESDSTDEEEKKPRGATRVSAVYSRESAVFSEYMRDSQPFLIKMRTKILATQIGSEEPIVDSPFKWMLDFVCENRNQDLMNHMRRDKSDFILLENSEAVKYLPKTSGSVPFGCSKKMGQMKTLELFDSVIEHLGSTSVHVGGPVWSMAWCPTPVGIKADQYLAVYCHLDPKDEHSQRYMKIHRTGIQIWNFGSLKNGKPCKKPELAYCLALDVGAVWDMAWCPTGCYDKNIDMEDSSVNRIGILAMACSAGFVEIVSIPHPKSIVADEKINAVFRPRKCWQLVQNCLGGSRNNCLCLDWQWKEECSKLIAGFGDGSVSFWNVNFENKLLSRIGPQGEHIRLPYKTIQAHSDAVVGIRFFQRIPEYFSTASSDRECKIWDTNSVNNPVETTARGMSRCLEVPVNNMNTFVGYDDAFNWNTNTVSAYDIQYMEKDSFNMFQIKSTATGLSFNNWINTLAVGTTGGEVILNYAHLLIHFYKIRKKHYLRRLKLYSTKITELTPTKDEDLGSDTETLSDIDVEFNQLSTNQYSDSAEKTDLLKIQLNSNTDSQINNVPHKGTKEVQNESNLVNTAEKNVNSSHAKPAAQKETCYGLIFCDSKLDNIKDIKTCPRARNAADTSRSESVIKGCELAAVNRVAWNPNLGSHLWLASGSNAGILRLNCVTALNTKQMDRILKEYDMKIRTKSTKR